MAAIINLSENEWVWVRFKISLSQSFESAKWLIHYGQIQETGIQDGCIIKLSQNEWVKIFFMQMVAEAKILAIQDGCHHQVEWEWKIDILFLAR